MKKEITPVLLWVDQIEFDRHLHLIQKRLIPILNKIKIEFLKLGIGPMDNAFLQDILFGNFKLIKEKLTEQIKNEVPSRFVKGEAINAANKLLSRLYNASEELKLTSNVEFSIIMDYPSVDDAGNIVLTDEAIQSLKDLNSKFCMTPRGQELLEAHRECVKALNRFYQMAKANMSDNPNELGELFDFDEEGNIIASAQDYDWYLYARQLK